jgi:hypothetical protein
MAGWEEGMARTLRASDDHAAVGSDVNACDGLVVAFELVFEGEAAACSSVELDIVVAGYSEGGVVGGEGVIGDGAVEKMVNFRRGHGGW